MVTTSDGVELWWDLDGDGHVVLLVPGRGDPSDLFPDEFTTLLQRRGFSTLRWDPRDTGLSGDGGGTYTVETMAEDAVAVLDAAGVERAHVVGVSMAGLILAQLGARHRRRVASLTFISAMSPDPDAGMGEDFFDALEDVDRVEALIRAMGDVDEADRLWTAQHVAAAERRAAYRPDAVRRHQESAFRLGWPTAEDLSRIDVPCLVVHGRLDRILPLAHAEALAAGVPSATLNTIDGMGHLPRPADWTTIAGQIAAMVSD